MGCSGCVCKTCALWWVSGCPYGDCYDDYRAVEDPYTAHHPPRYLWSISHEPGEQEHWCRGGAFYPVDTCPSFVAITVDPVVRSCFGQNVTDFGGGHIQCGLSKDIGCERCMTLYGRYLQDD